MFGSSTWRALLGVTLTLATLAVLRYAPWRPAAAPTLSSLTVGFLPVT